jgi:hypothetical protein
MTTRLELRTSLRRRLEDTSATPLWDDAALNDFLAEAVRGYGTLFPRELVTNVNVTAGLMSVPVASPAIEPERIARVFDAAGDVVPRRGEERNGADAGGGFEQAWRWWAATLLLEHPVPVTGVWRIEYLGRRSLPSDDATAVEIVAGDEEIVLLLAAATALRRRAVEDAKRGGRTTAIEAAAEAAQREAEHLIARRRRRPRGGWLR